MNSERDRLAQPASPAPGAVPDHPGLKAAAAGMWRRGAALSRRAPLRTGRRGRFGDFSMIGRSVTINRPRGEVYAFSRNVANLARFMENVLRVEERDGTAAWTIRAPAGQTLRLETQIVEDRPGEQIVWRSAEGCDIRAEGRIVLRDASGGTGTVLTAIVAWIPPAGEIGRRLAGIWRRNPAAQTRHELNRLRMLLETGEVAAARAPD
jgi:uncharacterized membrane protein